MASFVALTLVLLIGQVCCQFGNPAQRDQTEEACFAKVADVFFVLDSSTSIYINDYKQLLQFVREVVTRFDVGQRTTRVGLLTFSDDITRPVLELSRFQTKSDALASISEQSLPYRTGVTNTDRAIRFVRENPQFRAGITKIIVVITDGGSRSPWITASESNLAREQGFYLCVIGVGQYQDEQEWRNIASDPDESFIYNVTSFRLIDQLKYTLPSQLCSLPPLEIYRRCNVERSAELFFVAGPGGTANAVQVIDKIVTGTVDNADAVYVSYLLGICSEAENVPLAGLDSYCNRQQAPGFANIETYVQLLSRLRSIARQSRRNARQVAVIFVDEETLRLNRNGFVSEVRNMYTLDNIEIILVDLGTRGYSNILYSLTSSRDDVITFAPGSVASQGAVVNALIDRTCTVINRDSIDFGYTPT